MDTDTSAAHVVAAVEQLRADRDQLLALNRRLLGLVCDLADRFDAADDGDVTVPVDLLVALRAFRDTTWQATIGAATTADFVTEA